jgi:hypothetical protein
MRNFSPQNQIVAIVGRPGNLNSPGRYGWNSVTFKEDRRNRDDNAINEACFQEAGDHLASTFDHHGFEAQFA